MSDFWSLLAEEADPGSSVSRWYCDRADCDGEPHGPFWHWCAHPVAGPHTPDCRHARGQQVPPVGDWFVFLMLAGRGLGKSRSAAEWLVDSALNQPAAEWCVIARNAADVRKNARDMKAGLVVIAERGGHLVQYNRHEEDIYLDNGAVIHCLSADKPDRLRGFNLAGAWADELGAWRYATDTWDYGLVPALRAGAFPRVVVTTTPRPTPLLKRLVKEAQDQESLPLERRTRVLRTGRTWDNKANLAANFIQELESAYANTRIGRQELEGELLLDISGALVTAEMIQGARVSEERPSNLEQAQEWCQTEFTRVVVAVDPAGTYGEASDETGIVVCAKGKDGHGYVVADRSCKKSPSEWAALAVAVFEQFHADRIIAETNMGHELVENTIRTVAPSIPFKPVNASRGKRLRAEPVTALYEQGRVHHVGVFPQLEEQLTEWTPELDGRAKKSPDRLDAMVHGMTELGLARFGAGAAFRSFIEKEKERADSGETALRAVERAKRRKPSVKRCDHRYRDQICVYCGTERAA